MASTAAATSTPKSARRASVSYDVKVSRAYSGYIEYVGSKLMARRPGPPNARNMWCMTSLDPLAAHTWSAPTRTPDSTAR